MTEFARYLYTTTAARVFSWINLTFQAKTFQSYWYLPWSFPDRKFPMLTDKEWRGEKKTRWKKFCLKVTNSLIHSSDIAFSDIYLAPFSLPLHTYTWARNVGGDPLSFWLVLLNLAPQWNTPGRCYNTVFMLNRFQFSTGSCQFPYCVAVAGRAHSYAFLRNYFVSVVKNKSPKLPAVSPRDVEIRVQYFSRCIII